MTDRSSPLAQRVRRLLGTASLGPEPPHPANGRTPGETGALFQSQVARLAHVVRDLQALERQRECELRALHERIEANGARARAALAAVEALIASAESQAPAAPATLFERMRARSATQALGPAQRESLAAWLADLRRVREELRALADQG